MVPVSLTSVHPARDTVSARKWNKYHTPLMGTYYITSKFACESECEVVLSGAVCSIFLNVGIGAALQQ